MAKERSPQVALTRRELLKGAAGAAALASTFAPFSTGLERTLPENAGPRTRNTFDFGWKFSAGDIPGAHLPDFADSQWRDVDLPHDWSVEGPFNENEPAGFCGGYLPTGVGWYRKRFRVADTEKDKKLTIEFDGIYQNSEVWMNGNYLGKRPYGYVPFYYDLTRYAKFGTDNLLAVKVDNSRQTNCRWYSGSGIYRHTWLTATNRVHISHWGTFIAASQVLNESAILTIRTRVTNDGERSAPCTLHSSVLDSSGVIVREIEGSLVIPQGGEAEFEQQVRVDRPRLWSVTDPYLYTVRSELRLGPDMVDESTTMTGIREATFDANSGFLLNGQRVKLNGVCLHHDAGCVGAAVPERVWERRLEILREMGCNAVRTSHNPFASEFLDLCDRMGFLVMSETFDEWKVPKGQIGPNGYSNYFDEWYERDVRNAVRRDRNHPSIILWSAGNEVGDQEAPHGAETLAKLLAAFRAEDPTRLVTVGCDHICSEPASSVARPEFLNLLDVVGYNYADRWRDRREKYYSIDRQTFPKRRFIGTESEAMGGIRGDYNDLFGGDTPEGFFQFHRGRNLDVEQLLKFVSNYDYVAGDFMWTGIDHLGEARWPMKSSFTGVLDTCGFKKDGFYFYQSQWTKEPVLHLFPHWNWNGKEGQVIPVTCYTNCDTVELFLNGRSFGVKGYAFPRLGMEGSYGNLPKRAKAFRSTADLHLSWDVPFEKGVLKAVGIKDGQVAATLELSTTGEPSAVDLSVDRTALIANRRDVAHLTVRILDKEGRLVPVANDEIIFKVEGEGRLLGVDNGDPQNHENYLSNRRRAFNGLCMALVQSTSRSGQIRIIANSPSLNSASVILTTKS
jgi:beta-galactosidase